MIRCPVSTLHRGQENYYGSTVNATQAPLVVQNPNPITLMKAFVDNTIVATSNGPTMVSPAEDGPDCTHILTLQAWDTQGLMYRIQYNINSMSRTDIGSWDGTR